MVSNPRSQFRGYGKQLYNTENFIKYNPEDWTANPKRICGTRKSYLDLQNKLKSAGFSKSNEGLGFRKNTKLNMSPDGKIINEDYLQQVAQTITSKMCPKCDTKKLLYRGEEMTFSEFYDQVSRGIIEPRGRVPKQFVCSCK